MELNGHVFVLVENLFAKIYARLRNSQSALNLGKRHAGFYLIHEYAGRGISELRAIHRIRAIQERKPLSDQRIGSIEVHHNVRSPLFHTRVRKSPNSSRDRMRCDALNCKVQIVFA